MFDDAFWQFMSIKIEEGRQQMVESIKAILNEKCKWEEKANYNDLAIMEPLLLAYLSKDREANYPLEQLIWGYLPRDQRPDSLEVLSDAKGVVYLPQLGYFKTDRPATSLQLRWHGEKAYCELYDQTLPIPFTFEPAWQLNGGVELMRTKHPLLEDLFVDEKGQPAEYEVRDMAAHHEKHLNKALELLEAHCSLYYSYLAQATRKVLVFNCEEMNSFAAMAAHGLAFLNAKQEDNEVFFIEDLAHQGGHVIFNMLTYETEEYFSIPADTPLASIIGNEQETRTIYDAFHGVFTEAMMLYCLDRCQAGAAFSEDKLQEIRARMVFILRRFGSDLHHLSHPGLFTPKGEWLLLHIMGVFKCTYLKYQALIPQYDFSNQPYNFSYATCKIQNQHLRVTVSATG